MVVTMRDIEAIGPITVIASWPAVQEPNASSRALAGQKGHIEIGDSSRLRARVAGCTMG
jgi:hypothetical protein